MHRLWSIFLVLLLALSGTGPLHAAPPQKKPTPSKNATPAKKPTPAKNAKPVASGDDEDQPTTPRPRRAARPPQKAPPRLGGPRTPPTRPPPPQLRSRRTAPLRSRGQGR